jgi:hypothetical protein
MQKMSGNAIIVRQPISPPHRCAIVPYITEDPGGFIDTGTELPGWDPHVYVSATGALEIAKAFGFPTPGALATAVARVTELEAANAELTEQLDRAQSQLDAVAVLQAHGYTAGPRSPRRTKAAV